MDVLSINVHPRDIRGLHELSVTSLKRMSIKVHPCDVRDYLDIISEHGIPGMNGLGPELAPNGLDGLNGLGPESSQEHTLLLEDN